MHYYYFHISDYLSHTRHLTPIEDIAFRRMLDQYYLHENPLSSDPVKLARSISMADHSTDVERIVNEFFTMTEGGWINKRADAEIFHYHSKNKQQSEAGKKSAESRKSKKQGVTNGFSTGVPTDVQPTNNQEPITNSVIKGKKASQLPADFQPNEDHVSFAGFHQLSISLEFTKFSDYCLANGKTYKDWNAALRTWLRNAVDFSKKNKPAGYADKVSNAMATLTGGRNAITS